MSNWLHAPIHETVDEGTYMVTAATYLREPFFSSPGRLDLLSDHLFTCTEQTGWELRAWAVMPNHYHFIASSSTPSTLPQAISKLHMLTAKHINRIDKKHGRRVWFQYWDSRITFQRSYLARLKYVNNNPAYHGLVDNPSLYRWCSAMSFERNATPAFRKTVESFKVDRLEIPDDF